jgi:hypothetical protein
VEVTNLDKTGQGSGVGVCGQHGQRAGRAWVVSEAECDGGRRDDEGAGDEGSVSRDAECYDDEMGQLETKAVTALLPAAAAHRHPLHITYRNASNLTMCCRLIYWKSTMYFT